MDGWNMILSYWVLAYFQGVLVSGRVQLALAFSSSISGFHRFNHKKLGRALAGSRILGQECAHIIFTHCEKEPIRHQWNQSRNQNIDKEKNVKRLFSIYNAFMLGKKLRRLGKPVSLFYARARFVERIHEAHKAGDSCRRGEKIPFLKILKAPKMGNYNSAAALQPYKLKRCAAKPLVGCELFRKPFRSM